MTQEEKHGTRDLTYSAWHRRMSIKRFVGIEKAQTLAMIDMDAGLYVECTDDNFEPLALVEVARDVGQSKCAKLTKNFARRCHPQISAWLVFYTPSMARNQADPNWPDIESFRVIQLWPEPETVHGLLTPDQWAQMLIRIRAWGAKKLDDANT